MRSSPLFHGTHLVIDGEARERSRVAVKHGSGYRGPPFSDLCWEGLRIREGYPFKRVGFGLFEEMVDQGFLQVSSERKCSKERTICRMYGEQAIGIDFLHEYRDLYSSGSHHAGKKESREVV